jgi:hypothetical protein
LMRHAGTEIYAARQQYRNGHAPHATATDTPPSPGS